VCLKGEAKDSNILFMRLGGYVFLVDMEFAGVISIFREFRFSGFV
jgi:hypothetical protein